MTLRSFFANLGIPKIYRHDSLSFSWIVLHYCTVCSPQSRTRSPQASWSGGGRRERSWGNRIVNAGILRLTVPSFVKVCYSEQPIKKIEFFYYSSLPATIADQGARGHWLRDWTVP